MTMPQDPGVGTTPSTDVAGDPAGAVSNQSQSELYQDAINSAIKTEESSQSALQALYDQLGQLGPDPGDVDSITGGPGPKSQQWLKQTQDLDKQIQAASTQLAQAKRATAQVYTKIASDSSTRARIQGQTPEWAAQAADAAAAAKFKTSQAALLDAYGAQKDQATIQKLQADAQNALADVNLRSQQVTTSASQATLNNAKAVQLNELTPELLKLDAARTSVYLSQAQDNVARSAYLNSRAAKEQAQTDYLIPAQVDRLVQQGLLDQARADQIKAMGPVKVDELNAKIGLDTAKINQIKAALTKWNVLPSTDRTSPTIVEQQPVTGEVRGVPNPGYVNTTLQGINDQQAAIQQIQNEISNGTMTPDDGNQLIANLRQSLQYKALGVTPDQYLQAQNQQAQLGMNVLNNYMGTINKGQDVANQFLSAARGARGLGGMQFSPFSTMGQIAQNVYGPSLAKAQSLINQVQPVTDRFSALQAFSQLSQVKQHLQAATQQGGDTGQQNPADQATNAGINQAQNVTAAAGGTPNVPSQMSQLQAAGGAPNELGIYGMSGVLPQQFAQSGLSEGRGV